jgi:hypothetical protein
MSGFQGYDQWKTASPYDDEPDPIEEAERWLKENTEKRKTDPEIERVSWIIEYLLGEV